MTGQRMLRVVLAEDCATDAELTAYALKRAGLAAEIAVVTSEAEFRAALARVEPDVIVSDNAMPEFSGRQALAIARELVPDVPFVFLSGTLASSGDRGDVLSQAAACVDKNQLDRLAPTVLALLQDRAGLRGE